MKKLAERILKFTAFIICLPLIATIFIRPVQRVRVQKDYDTNVINERFSVMVDEGIGVFYYTPEQLTQCIMYRMIPPEMTFSPSEDYIADTGKAHDPEQEYLKALSVVCRSNILAAWEAQQCPAILGYDTIGLGQTCFCDIPPGDNRFREIQRAAEATEGAVVTNDNGVAAVPFFTSTPSDILVSQAGDGTGFSLNFSYELACRGMDFYEILKYFLGSVQVKIYG